MFVNKLFTCPREHISKSKMCVKSSIYYFHRKRKILTDFQFCISVPLKKAAPMLKYEISIDIWEMKGQYVS